MILAIDASERDRMLFGLVDGKKITATCVPLADSSFDVLDGAVQFLQRHRSTLSSVRTLIVVQGPGRFSGLRLTSVLANTLHWSEGTTIMTVRGGVRGETAKERIVYMQEHAFSTKSVKPFYGKPPSITKPRKS